MCIHTDMVAQKRERTRRGSSRTACDGANIPRRALVADPPGPCASAASHRYAAQTCTLVPVAWSQLAQLSRRVYQARHSTVGLILARTRAVVSLVCGNGVSASRQPRQNHHNVGRAGLASQVQAAPLDAAPAPETWVRYEREATSAFCATSDCARRPLHLIKLHRVRTSDGVPKGHLTDCWHGLRG